MIRLAPFKKEHYATLIAWVKTEEELMQFGGPQLNFPLTEEQLDHLLSNQNTVPFVVINDETNLPIGHAEIYLSEASAKLSRILIGVEELRGKGIGFEIVTNLLSIIFNQYEKQWADLNVFDWNLAAINCYQKAGFTLNPNKRLERKIKDQTWIAINMVITKEKYLQRRLP